MTVAAASKIGTSLGEFRLTVSGREVSVRHARALVSWVDEQRYLGEDGTKQYGMLLWPASIALALEIGERAARFRGKRVLELGAGVGLPGIAAAALGARVVQTDRDEEALTLCRENAGRNGVATDVRNADWSSWNQTSRHDWLIASDILYRPSLHAQLVSILADAARAGTRILVADPMRPASLRLLEQMERDGWSVRMTRYTIGTGELQRVIGVFDLELHARAM